MNTNDSSLEAQNLYSVPRSRLVDDTGSSLVWDEFSKRCAEKMLRWRTMTVLAVHCGYWTVNCALFFAVQILLGEETIVQLHPIGLLLVVVGYVASFALAFVGCKLWLFFYFRHKNVKDFVTMMEKNQSRALERPLVLTLYFVFIASVCSLPVFQLLAVDFQFYGPLATLVAFPVVFLLSYPICRAVIRESSRLLEAMNPAKQDRTGD